MPNRILKESITTSPNLDKVSCHAENLFYRLMVQVDDYGRFDAEPTIVASRCWPRRYGQMAIDQIQEWLTELVANDILDLYEVEGRPYLRFVNWERHQQVRTKKSRYPDPADGKPLTSCYQMQADEIICSPARAESESESESESEKTAAPKRKRGRHRYPDEFERFWSAYPTNPNASKKTAHIAWKKRIKAGVEAVELERAAVNYAVWCERSGKESPYIPHASTWLNEDRDEGFMAGVPPPEKRGTDSGSSLVKAAANIRHIREGGDRDIRRVGADSSQVGGAVPGLPGG